MKTILFISSEGEIGGAEKSLLLLVKYLRRRFAVRVACPAERRVSKALKSLGVKTYHLPEPPRGRYMSCSGAVYWLKVSWAVFKVILKVRPAIIHANNFFAASVALVPSLLTSKTLVAHCRDLTTPGFVIRLCGLTCAKIIAVSESVKNWLTSKGTPASKITVIYNGTDYNGLDKRLAEDGSQITTMPDKGHFIFAHVGQLVPWKNQLIFIEAASQLRHQLPEARFLLVGDDIFGRNSAYKGKLLDRIKRSPIAERIDFVGWQEKMEWLWQKINCLVHTAEREPFGRVVLEAMAHKVPVIAADSCGPGEIICNGHTGLLFRPGDVEQLSRAMLRIACDKDLAERLAKAAYRHVMSNFTAAKTAEKTGQIYREIISSG